MAFDRPPRGDQLEVDAGERQIEGAVRGRRQHAPDIANRRAQGCDEPERHPPEGTAVEEPGQRGELGRSDQVGPHLVGQCAKPDGVGAQRSPAPAELTQVARRLRDVSAICRHLGAQGPSAEGAERGGGDLAGDGHKADLLGERHAGAVHAWPGGGTARPSGAVGRVGSGQQSSGQTS